MMKVSKEVFLEDIKERVQTILNDLESWVISDPDIDIVIELTSQLYDEIDSLVEE